MVPVPTHHESPTIHEINLIRWAFVMHVLGFEVAIHYYRARIFPTAEKVNQMGRRLSATLALTGTGRNL